MFRPATVESSTKLSTLCLTTLFSGLALLAFSQAAPPLTSATITKLENKVTVGARRAGRDTLQPAKVSDTIRSNNFVVSEADSRAEIQYADGSVVRIGQNTVFTFDAGSRTLDLEKGSMIFHIPKGTGGGTVKTPSLTAAISGTTVKVSPTIFAVIEGSLKMVPSGRVVRAGEFVRINGDGSLTIAAFDSSKTNNGKLVDWDGFLPGFETRELPATGGLAFNSSELRFLEVLHRANDLPNSKAHFFPIRSEEEKRKDPGNKTLPPTPTPPPRAMTPRPTPSQETPGFLFRSSRSTGPAVNSFKPLP